MEEPTQEELREVRAMLRIIKAVDDNQIVTFHKENGKMKFHVREDDGSDVDLVIES